MSHSRTPQQHRAAVDALIGPRPTVQLPLTAALGRSLTESVMAPGDLPQFDNSQMDGYAVAECHLDGGSFPIGPTIAAGIDPDAAGYYPHGLTAQSGDSTNVAVAPIMTGAKIPAGTAAIIPIERCQPDSFQDSGYVTVPSSARGDFIRRQGSDLARGDTLFAAGHVVNPRTIGAAAAAGLSTLPVVEPARVIICTGGDEIGEEAVSEQTKDSAHDRAMILDANGPMLESLCAQHQIEVVGRIRTRDEPEALDAALRSAVDRYSPTAIITSGGISQGRFEVVRQVLEPSGGWFGHVDQQPGGPQGLAMFADTPVISLPGNPVSTAVSFRLFVAPVLGEASDPLRAQVSEELIGLQTRECFLRAKMVWKENGVWAEPVSGKSSHLLAQSTTADCLLAVPADCTLHAGDMATIYPW